MEIKNYKKKTQIQINIIEYLLSKYAKSIGINIYNEKYPQYEGLNNSIIQKYINSNTFAIFDATGGRLFPYRKNNFEWDINGEKKRKLFFHMLFILVIYAQIMQYLNMVIIFIVQ